MILGSEAGQRSALHNTPHWADKGARVGEVVGFVLHRAIDAFGHASMLEGHVRSYVGRSGKVSADPETARAYVRALDAHDEYSRTSNFVIDQARNLIDAQVELRLTGIESDQVLGEGLLRAVNYKKGQLLLAGDDSQEHIVDFSKPRFTGRGFSRDYAGSALLADVEVLNPDIDALRPLIHEHLL